MWLKMSSGGARQRFARARGVAREDECATQVSAGEFGALLARVARDPDVVCLELMEAPVEDEVRQLRACLRRAPHVAEVRLTSNRFEEGAASADLERWLEAVPPSTLVYLDDEGVSAALAAQLINFGAQRLRFYRPQIAEAQWIAPSHALRHLHLEYDSNMGRDADLREETQLFSGALQACTALASLHLEHGELGAEAIAVLSAFVGASTSLTSLELSDSMGRAGDLEPLWVGLRDSETSVLARLSVSARGQTLAAFGEFLASSRARGHLLELDLSSCSPETACLLLPAIAEHCDNLVNLQLGFVTAMSGFVSLDVAVTYALFKDAARLLAGLTRRVTSRALLSLGLSGGEIALSKSGHALLFEFLALCTTTAPGLHVLAVGELASLPVPLFDAVERVRVLDLAFSKRKADVQLISAALVRNACVERIRLRNLDELSALELISWFKREKPSALTELDLALDSVSCETFVTLLDALSALPALTSLRFEAGSGQRTVRLGHDACSVAITRLLCAAPSRGLRAITIDIPFSIDEKHVGAEKHSAALDQQVEQAVLAHPSLEETNLVPGAEITGEAEDGVNLVELRLSGTAAVLESRRLRRHRLAGHWAQVSVLLAFARAHDATLHGAALPLLSVISALAGLILPEERWAQRFMATHFFSADAHDFSSAATASRGALKKRKRS